MHVDVVDRPELRVAGVRHVGPYNQIESAFARLGAVAGPAGLIGRPGIAMMGIYHDDPRTTPPEALRSDAALVVPEGLSLPAELTEHRIRAGHYARGLHTGPYASLPDSWAHLVQRWLPTSGYRRAVGPGIEVYLNDPTHTPPEQLKTEIYIPVER